MNFCGSFKSVFSMIYESFMDPGRSFKVSKFLWNLENVFSTGSKRVLNFCETWKLCFHWFLNSFFRLKKCLAFPPKNISESSKLFLTQPKLLLDPYRLLFPPKIFLSQ